MVYIKNLALEGLKQFSLHIYLLLFIKFLFEQLHLKKNTLNPFKPEFTIVIFIHYMPRIAVAILDL